MFCLHCGSHLPDDSRFCNVCGTKLVQVEQHTPGTFSSPGGATHFDAPQTPLMPFGSDTQYPTWQKDVYASSHESNAPDLSWQVQAGRQSNVSNVSSIPVQQPAILPPDGRMQQFLLRTFGYQLARSAIFGALLGSIVATLLGIVATALLLTVAHLIAPHATGGNANMYYGENTMDTALGFTPLHDLLRNTLQFFFVMQGAGEHFQYIYSSTNTVYTFFAPLSGLLIIPALVLMFGGYLAASTDFQHHLRSSLLRGAAIAIPYTVLLLLLISPTNGCIPVVSSQSTTTLTCSTVLSQTTQSADILTMDTTSVILFGLLWGLLFGLLGASLKYAQGNWRSMLYYYARITKHPQVLGMIMGGLAAAALGIFLALLVVVSFVAYSSFSAPLLTQATCSVTSDWQSLVAWSIAQAPIHAVNLWFFSFGAPINITNPQNYSCFYIRTGQASLSLFGTTPQLSSWLHLLLALPIICLFLGGRASVAMSRVRGSGPAAIQGALIALPFTAVMLLLIPICTLTITTASISGSTSITTPIVQSAGTSIFDLLLWAVISSAVLGAIGGLYQASSLKVGVSKALHVVALPIILLGTPLYFVLDRLSGQPRQVPRSTTRTLLYTTFFVVIVLVIAAGVAGELLISMNQTISLATNQKVSNIASVVLVALPGLLLISTGAAALCRDPIARHQQASQSAGFTMPIPSLSPSPYQQ